MWKKKALIVGTNVYEDPGFEELKYAENDARAIYRILVNPDIGDFKEEDVILLTGKIKSEVEENLEIILNEAKRDDLVFIYFAGHGKLDKSGNLCLAAKNTKTDRLLTTSVHLEHIRTIIDQSDCRRIVFIIDSCFSGAVGQTFRSGGVPAESFEQISGQGKVIISASQAYERARELDDIGHGIFTYNLVRGLEEGEADHDEDGYISIEELYRHVCNKVKTETKGQQMPMKWGIDEKGEIVVAKSIKTLEKKRAEIERLSMNARDFQAQGRLDEASEAWAGVLRLDSANTEAPSEIIQIEEEKRKRAELEEKIDKLFEYYKNGDIPGPIYNKAVAIIRNPRSTGDGEEIFPRLIDDLLDGHLTLENFVLSWDRVEEPGGQAEIKESKQGGGYKDTIERTIIQREEDNRSSQTAPPEEENQGKNGHSLHEKTKIPPKKIIPVTDQSRKWTMMFAGGGIIVLIIAAIIIYKKINPTVLSPEIVYFRANPTKIEKGGSSSLEWSTSNAKDVEISGIGKIPSSGSRTVSPVEAVTYVLIARSEEGGTVEKEVTVSVEIPLPKIEDFRATPETIERGKSSALSWKTSNTVGVELSGIGKVESSGSKMVSPAETTTYTLIARSEGGKMVEGKVTVTVGSKGLPEFSEETVGDDKILYQDNFTTLDPAWGLPSPNLGVKDGKLVIQPDINQGWTVINQANLFKDMDARVKVTLVKTDAPISSAGLIFWAKGYSDYYNLSVNSGEGRFTVARWLNDRWLYPVALRENAAVNKGVGQANRLRVVTEGNRATVYINETEVATFKGQPPQGGGFIGLTAYSPEKSRNVWEFDDLKVVKPEQIAIKPSQGGEILYEDYFTTLDPAWGGPSSNLSVKDNKLILQPDVNLGFVAMNQARLFEDIDASVKTRMAKSDQLNWGGGLVFWAKDFNDYYSLMVSGDGKFSVGHWVNNRWLYPVFWNENAVLKKGLGEWNQLRVVTKGNRAIIYINDTEVIAFKGEPPKGGGLIGVRGSSTDKSRVIWEFSELKITKPQS